MNDNENMNKLKEFVANRGTPPYNRSSTKYVNNVYYSFIKPLLRLNKNTLKIKKEETIGEFFALSIHAKRYIINNYIHQPKVNKLTPDFLVNNDTYFEIYCPTMNRDINNKNYYLQKDHNGKFSRINLTSNIEEKSSKYKNLKLTIIVLIICNDFLNDLKNSLKNVELKSNNHKLFLYFGDKEINYDQS